MEGPPAAQLTVTLDSALRDGLVSEAAILHRIVALRRQGMHGIPRLPEVIEGPRSHVARTVGWNASSCVSSRRPDSRPPRAQQTMGAAVSTLMRVDFWFAGTSVVIEVLGSRWHRTAENLRRDTERMNALIARGYELYQFTYAAVTENPGHVGDMVERALRGRGSGVIECA